MHNPSLHDIHLDIENTCTALETLIFLLGQAPTHSVDEHGICRLLELVSYRLEKIFKAIVYHADQEEMVCLQKSQGGCHHAA